MEGGQGPFPRHHQRGGAVEVEVASTSRNFAQSFPLPRPRSPPDIHGKLRKQTELNNLDKEIVVLEEALNTLEGLPPASTCCKEVEEFVNTQPDPFLPRNGETQRIRCQPCMPCCCWCDKHPCQRDTSCFSCNIWKKLKCSCMKLSCNSCCKVPSTSCKCCKLCFKFPNCGPCRKS